MTRAPAERAAAARATQFRMTPGLSLRPPRPWSLEKKERRSSAALLVVELGAFHRAPARVQL